MPHRSGLIAAFLFSLSLPAAHAQAPVQAVPLARKVPAHGAVTGVQLVVIPIDYVGLRYSGPCPAKLLLVGTIDYTGPGTAYYQLQAGAIHAEREGKVQVGSGGTKVVLIEGEVRRTPQVKMVRFLAGLEPRGHQENARWADAPLDYECTGTAPPPRGP